MWNLLLHFQVLFYNYEIHLKWDSKVVASLVLIMLLTIISLVSIIVGKITQIFRETIRKSSFCFWKSADNKERKTKEKILMSIDDQ
jgi:hypothetical protein